MCVYCVHEGQQFVCVGHPGILIARRHLLTSCLRNRHHLRVVLGCIRGVPITIPRGERLARVMTQVTSSQHCEKRLSSSRAEEGQSAI